MDGARIPRDPQQQNGWDWAGSGSFQATFSVALQVVGRPVSGLTSGTTERSPRSAAPSRESGRVFKTSGFAVAPSRRDRDGGCGLTRSPLRGQRRNESSCDSTGFPFTRKNAFPGSPGVDGTIGSTP